MTAPPVGLLLCVAPAFPCHLHMNEGKIGHQLLRSEMEMVFQTGWEGPWVPAGHTSNCWVVKESKMLIERAQSYSPQSRAAAWERSRYKRCDGKGKATQPPCHAVPRPWGWGHTVGSPPGPLG